MAFCYRQRGSQKQVQNWAKLYYFCQLVQWQYQHVRKDHSSPLNRTIGPSTANQVIAIIIGCGKVGL